MTFHANSRTSKLAAMSPGDSTWFQVPDARTTPAFMSNIGVDTRRVEAVQDDIEFTQKKWIAVDPVTAETIILIRVSKTYKPFHGDNK